MRNLLRHIWYIATGRRQEVDLADEMAFHREMKAQELRDAGVSEADIAAGTQRALGNDLTARQQSRDVWEWPWLQDISQDVRFGVRMLAKDRRFTSAAVLALGLGIGVNNTVFTIINAALLKELPFPDPSRLIDLRLMDARGGSWFITIALVALILAMVGLYALTAHGVAQRAQEIGVRMALGAQAGQVVWLFVRRTLLQVVIGLALGIAGALAVGKLLSTFLRDTDPRDPVTLVLVSVLLVVVAMVASIWPARKAARVDPVIALRAD